MFNLKQEGPAGLQLVESGRRPGWGDACLELPVLWETGAGRSEVQVQLEPHGKTISKTAEKGKK